MDSRLASLLTQGPRPIDNLLFLLASSSMLLGCPGDDGSAEGGDSTSTGSQASTTGGLPDTTGAVDSTGGTSNMGSTSTGGSTGDTTAATGEESSGSGGSSGSEGSGSGSSGSEGSTGATTGGLTPAEVCPAFGVTLGACYMQPAAYFETICYDQYGYYLAMYGMSCAAAYLDLFACASTLDCASLMMDPAVVCPAEWTAYEAECPVMPPPPPPPPMPLP